MVIPSFPESAHQDTHSDAFWAQFLHWHRSSSYSGIQKTASDRYSGQQKLPVLLLSEKLRSPLPKICILTVPTIHAEGILYINDKQYDVIPGDIVFINPGLLHYSYRKTSGRMFHIVFDLKLLTNPAIESDINAIVYDLMQRKIQLIVKPDRESKLYQKLRPIVENLTEYHDTTIPFGYESCRITASLFLLMSVFCQEDCFVHVEKSSLYKMNHVAEIIDFVSVHYKSPIVVRDLAEHTGLSEGYIYNLFRDYVGVTPVGYINSLRIREAYLLLDEGLSVTETAAEVGFINVSYFIKILKKQPE